MPATYLMTNPKVALPPGRSILPPPVTFPGVLERGVDVGVWVGLKVGVYVAVKVGVLVGVPVRLAVAV